MKNQKKVKEEPSPMSSYEYSPTNYRSNLIFK